MLTTAGLEVFEAARWANSAAAVAVGKFGAAAVTLAELQLALGQVAGLGHALDDFGRGVCGLVVDQALPEGDLVFQRVFDVHAGLPAGWNSVGLA